MGHPMTLTVMSRHLRIMGLVPTLAIVDSGKIVDTAGGANYELTEKNFTRSCLRVFPPCWKCCKIQSIIEEKERAVPRNTRSTSVPTVVARLKAQNARVETLIPPAVSLACVVHGWDCTHVLGSPSSVEHVRIRAAVLEFDTSSTRANPLVCSPAVMTDRMFI